MKFSQEAVIDVAKVFHFEFWLRYYFVEEKNEALYITLNEGQVKQMQTQFPEYWELVERVLDTPLSPELSQRVVVEFLQIHVEGTKYPVNTVSAVLDSKDFGVEMYLFDSWIDLHEEQLMQKIYGYDYWMHSYEEWKQSEKGQLLLQSVKLQLHGESDTIN